MKKVFIMLTLLLSLCTQNCFADEATEKMYLTQILNQLEAIQPLVLAAQKAQPANTRIQFHYTHYKDAQGKTHNGLLEDIQAIKGGITQKLNDSTIAPRVFAPLKGDYLTQK